MLSQDIEIPIIGANFVKDILWPVPLIEYLLNHVLVSIKSKTNRPLIRLPSRVAIDFQLHLMGIFAHTAPNSALLALMQREKTQLAAKA